MAHDTSTCGKGLAEHATLPATLADLLAAMADNLERHRRTLDLSDAAARSEHDAYVTLANEYADIARRLQSTAAHMAASHDLPMGRHDQRALADPAIVTAFEKFVGLERDVIDILERDLERDVQLLTAMRGAR
jgi:hypothetical protein